MKDPNWYDLTRSMGYAVYLPDDRWQVMRYEEGWGYGLRTKDAAGKSRLVRQQPHTSYRTQKDARAAVARVSEDSVKE